MHPLRPHLRALDRVFREKRDKHEAHRAAHGVLEDMAADPRVLPAILEKHLSHPANLNTKNFPSLGFAIAKTAHYTLVANSFFPHPDGTTDETFNSVHHHGELLLTTVSAHGPGYEHWLFETPKPVDPERDLFAIKLTSRARHEKGKIAFVDAYSPHAVMYPSALTLTYALWTHRTPTSWRDRVKQLPVFRGREEKLAEVAARFGLRRALDLNSGGYYDYFPTDGGFCGMKKRVQFERGPNADYLESIFSILQDTGNQALGRVALATLDEGGVDDPTKVRALASRLSRGEPIRPVYSEGLHLGIPHMNFKADAILRTVS